jgi:hypothetical protein
VICFWVWCFAGDGVQRAPCGAAFCSKLALLFLLHFFDWDKFFHFFLHIRKRCRARHFTECGLTSSVAPYIVNFTNKQRSFAEASASRVNCRGAHCASALVYANLPHPSLLRRATFSRGRRLYERQNYLLLISAKNASPKRESLASPTPETCKNSCSFLGLRRHISFRVASVKMM